MYPFGSLPANLAAFCAVLRREHGFRIGPAELGDAARALEVVDLGDQRAVRDALRPILSGTRQDAEVFDRAFTDFFVPGPVGVPQTRLPATGPEATAVADAGEAGTEAARRAPRARSDQEAEEAGEGARPAPSLEPGEEAPGEAALPARVSYSPLEAEGVEAPEIEQADDRWRLAARAFVRRLHLGLSRRWRPGRRGRRFDLRRTLRASLQTGGETLAPRWLRRPRRSPRLVLLIDGSRSMSACAATALRLAVALATVTLRVEVFAFSTGIRRVTGGVRQAAAGRVHRLDDLRSAWGGGTSIGACLREFLGRFGERLLGPDTVVIVISDGLDVGRAETLRGAMRELARRAAAIVWLNPLIDTPGYEPTAEGMRTALPYVTTFASVGNVEEFVRLSRLVRVRA